MKKLFVDDWRPAPDETWTVARTITEAINIIELYDFDVISLDHDITHGLVLQLSGNGAKNELWGCSENFKAVAKYVALKYKTEKKKPDIIIHTMNVGVVNDMMKILDGFSISRDSRYVQE